MEVHPERVAAVAAAGIAAGLHPGMQVYASVRGRVVADFGIGTATDDVAMTASTPVPWFSTTKPVVALVFVRLAVASGVDIDDPVARVLPAFAAGGKEGVTFRHLLTHAVPYDEDLRVADVMSSWDDATAAVCALTLRASGMPGRVAKYTSFASWHALAAAAVVLGGAPLGELVRSSVFEPLGVDRSWVGVPAELLSDVAAVSAGVFDTRDRRPIAIPVLGEADFLAATVAGMGGVGPMREQARVYEALVEGRSAAIGIPPELFERMTTTHRRGMKDARYGGDVQWGLGFITDRRFLTGPRLRGPVFGHDGRRCAIAVADRESGLVICAMANGLPEPVANRHRFRALVEAICDEAGLSPPRRASRVRARPSNSSPDELPCVRREGDT